MIQRLQRTKHFFLSLPPTMIFIVSQVVSSLLHIRQTLSASSFIYLHLPTANTLFNRTRQTIPMAPIALHNCTKLGTQKTSKKTRLKHIWTTLSKWLVSLAWRIYMKSTISASHVMEYATNDNLLTIHEKYLHSIFHISHTSQIGKLNFSVKNTLQQNTDKSPWYTTYHRFLQLQIQCFSNDLPCLALRQIVHPGHTLTLLQHLTMTSEIFSKTLQYFSKTPLEDLQQHNGIQIANLQRIQCIICIDQERNTLLLICKHLLACRECLLRCHNRFPLCLTVTTQMISVLC